MKKLIMVLSVMVTMLLLTGCGSDKKESITAEDFYNKVNETYKLTDITSRIGYAKKAYAYEQENLYFYFYEGNRSFDIGNIYIDEVQNVAGSMSNKQDEISKGENFSSIKIFNDEEYYRIEYVDNTFLYAKSTYANKGAVDNLFDKVGY